MIYYIGKRKRHNQHLRSRCEFFRVLEYPNNVFVSFDPFGFSENDFQTGISLMRCDSHCNLYLITTSYRLLVLLIVSGTVVLDILVLPLCSLFIAISSLVINLWNLWKFVHLVTPFESLHSGLWTSPVFISAGHHIIFYFLMIFWFSMDVSFNK